MKRDAAIIRTPFRASILTSAMIASVLALMPLACSSLKAATGPEKKAPPPDGSLAIAARGPNGQTVKGFSTGVAVPGPDGSLKPPNMLVNAVDGGENDFDGSTNGTVVLAPKSFAGNLAKGQPYMVILDHPDHAKFKSEQLTYQGIFRTESGNPVEGTEEPGGFALTPLYKPGNK